MSSLTVVTEPAVEPITLAEAKYHCRVDLESYDEDTEIEGLITGARRQAEAQLKRYLITQTVDLRLDEFPYWEIKLPPAQSITAITYYDASGVEQTMSASLYLADTSSDITRITPAYGQVWPVTRYQNNAVKVRFVAGYGLAAAVPACIKNWMKMRIKTLYEAKDQLGTSNGNLLVSQSFVDSLLDPERVRGYL